MNQENKLPTNDSHREKFLFMISRNKLENKNEEQSSITPKRPLLSRDRVMNVFNDISPLSNSNSRFDQTKNVHVSITPAKTIKNDQSPKSIIQNHVFSISRAQSKVVNNDDNTHIPAYIQRKARPAPLTTWKAPIPIPKSSTMLKTIIESSSSSSNIHELLLAPSTNSFQPAIRPRIPFNLSSVNTIDKQTHAYTIWLNGLFTPVEFMSNTTIIQPISNEQTAKTLNSLVESKRWHTLRDHAREIFIRDVQSIAAKISADIDISQCRINPKSDLSFSPRAVNRQALFNFISSYNRIWFHLAMEVLFPINIKNDQQMKFAIDQYLLQSTNNTSSETNTKKTILNNNNNKTASVQIRLTVKNLMIIVIFLEHAKLLRLIDNDPCLYNRDSKFKSTKESIDVLSRDFISSDTNLLRRLKLAGYEPTYKQTSLDEFNYLLSNNENKLFEDLKDGIRLTRCTQILLASTNEHVARFDLSNKLKCPVVNLVHKLLNIDQAFELLQNYGNVNLTGISNKDIMNGNKQITLELLWRIFISCYLSKHLSPIDKLNEEIFILKENLSKFSSNPIEQQLITIDLTPLQKQHVEFTSTIHLLIKWVQLICAHYKFWLYDLQESFADGRALLYIISYYLPSLCDYKRDIKHVTTLATCQTRDEHIEFNLELGQQQLTNVYERNVKSNFRLLEECIKQFGTFSYDLVKYESYAKDIPDERCTIMTLAMFAYDLIFSNNNNNENNFRHQQIFQELKEKYSSDDESIVHLKKEEIRNSELLSQHEIDTIQDNSMNSSEISMTTNPLEEKPTFKHSSPYETKLIYSNPRAQFESTPSSFEEDEKKLILFSPSVLNSMNYDILDRLELLSQLDHSDEDDYSFNSEKSNSTTRINHHHHHRSSFAATMAAISLHDFIELEKTIENEENKTPTDTTSLSLMDQTISSEVDSVELNKLDQVSFVDSTNRKLIKETLALFLSHQQHTLRDEESVGHHRRSIEEIKNEQHTEAEREINAAQIFQAYWRGRQVRLNNELNHHSVVAILEKLRSYNSIDSSSLTLRERLIQIVQEYSELSASSLTGHLQFLNDIEPIIIYSLEIRCLIAEQGLLRLFFILMRCCNRSEPSTILLLKVLNILQLFTIKHYLIMKLIDKSEHIKDCIRLLLKFYQNNDCELFAQICFLFQTIVNDEEARKILRSNKSFTQTIVYIYKRIFNKITIEDEKHRQQVRSTPKQSTGSIKRPNTILNQSSILYQTPKNTHRSISSNQNENMFKRNLVSIEQFMNFFYRD
ncbi:unnamed protein product [Rotaria socialis]|uniref:Calponin-homology (CH) domain-containing protein n=2 Tax=Rotaria socialis TaxID=392032 RepID=A0A818E2F4_9BILA|nr:unnamed protein product [Rotaria socialis]